MAKLTLASIISGFGSTSLFNSNFNAIIAALENTLSRDGTSPNSMNADLDMNGHAILNGGATVIEGAESKGDWVTPTAYDLNNIVYVTVADDASYGGASYICREAHTSGTFSTDYLTSNYWQDLAKRGASGAGSGDLISTNNLSDVANAATALTNLGGLSTISSDTTPQLGGNLDCNGKQVQWSKGADVASAPALPITTDGNYFDVTGTTTITSISTIGGSGTIKLHFDGAVTLTHHATTLVLPGGANFTTTAGDELEFTEYAADSYRCTGYALTSGDSMVGGTIVDDSVVSAKLTKFISAEQTITPAGSLTIAHGLGYEPLNISLVFVCKTADIGYTSGQRARYDLMPNVSGSLNRGLAYVCDSTNIYVRFGSNSVPFGLMNWGTGTGAGMTEANWKMVVEAF